MLNSCCSVGFHAVPSFPSFLYFRSFRSSYHRHLDYVGAAEEANVVHEQAACVPLHLLSVLKRTCSLVSSCSLIHGKWLDIRATCAENEPHSARKRPDSPASGAPYHGTWRGFAHCSSGLRERAACPAATTQHKAAARVGADPPARSLSLRVASLSVSAVPSALSHRVLRGAEGPQRERERGRETGAANFEQVKSRHF